MTVQDPCDPAPGANPPVAHKVCFLFKKIEFEKEFGETHRTFTVSLQSPRPSVPPPPSVSLRTSPPIPPPKTSTHAAKVGTKVGFDE